jgi:aminoglycoside 6'-N-acetyltransferase I
VRSFLDGSFRWPWTAPVAAEEGRWLGLAELSIRPCAEGCSTSDVAHLEGWYVRPEARGRGAGRALIDAAEACGAD